MKSTVIFDKNKKNELIIYIYRIILRYAAVLNTANSRCKSLCRKSKN